MRHVRTELAYLNRLVRELITSSAAGFVGLAIAVALMTVFLHFEDVQLFLRQINSQTIGEHTLTVPNPPIASANSVSTVGDEGSFLIAGDVSETITAAPAPPDPVLSGPVAAPVEADPTSPDISSDDDERESDKKDVNYGTNKAGNSNSSYHASEKSYDKLDKDDTNNKS